MKKLGLNPELLQSFYDDFSKEQLTAIRKCLGFIPDDSLACYDLLLQRWKRNEVGMFTKRDNQNEVIAFCFFQIDVFPTGNDFAILATISLNRENIDLMEQGAEQLTKFAKHVGCKTMSIRTIRIGLVKKICTLPGWFASETILRKIL